MKIGICGKMCSGKSTLAKQLITYFKINHNIDYTIDSFAKKIYELAYELFNMKQKDRELLQSIGTKMREIDNDVWINHIIKKNYKNVIIDDVRYKNELETLKKNGYLLIKLNISKDYQINRLKSLYKDKFDEHYRNMNHVSEMFIDVAPDDIFDIIINVDTEKINILEIVKKHIVSLC